MRLVRKIGLVQAISEMSGWRQFKEMTPLVYSAAGDRLVLRKRRKAHNSAPGIRFSRLPAIIGMVLFALGFCAGRTLYGASVKEANGKETKRVLILYSFDKEEDFFYGFDRTLRSGLASKLSDRVEFYTEYVDLVRFPGARHAEILAKLMKLKLSKQKPDLIIAVSYPALNFLLETGKDLFPETPIVFSCVGDSFREDLKVAIAHAGRRNVSGILLSNQQIATLKLAFQLQPETQRVVAVAGTTPLEKFWVNQLEKDLAVSQPGITFTYLSNMPMDDILKKVAALPPHTVIFYPYFFLDAAGSMFSPEEALDLISGAANVPVYGSFHSYIGHGLLGGQMLDFEDVAAKTAEDASRALRGEQTPGPEFAVDSTSSITVDWRELRRWNISESRLPPGTVVLFKEKSLLDRYRWYVLGVVTLCLCEAILILALLIQGARRKRAEEALRESEERLGLAVQAGRMYAFEWDMASDVIVRTGQCRDILNWMDDPTRDTGGQFVASVHPDDREAYASPQTWLTPENPTYQTSYRVLRPDGTLIWLEASGRVIFDAQGKRLRIIGLVADVTARKQAEGALRESDERFRLVANNAPVLIWMSGADKLCTFFNKGWLDFTGRSIEQELGEGWASGVHADDLERCLGIYSSAFDSRVDFEMEYRLRRFDGEYRWIVDHGVPRFESNGAFCGYIGSSVDITDRKLAEASLQELGGRLIRAQEEERARIARELHDDLSQRIALLQIGLEQLAQAKGGLSSKNRQQLHDMAKVSTEVSSNIHDLSHQLHPYKLDSLGMVVSLGGFCREFSEQHQMQVQFVHHDIPGQIPKDLTLCLFRIAQEALRNVMKHSGASEARVELSGHGDEIDLCISDSGVGFDPESVKGEGGLGLISMRERLRLVRGHLAVESEPSHGTRIRVRVPLFTNKSGITGEGKAHKAGA